MFVMEIGVRPFDPHGRNVWVEKSAMCVEGKLLHFSSGRQESQRSVLAAVECVEQENKCDVTHPREGVGKS